MPTLHDLRQRHPSCKEAAQKKLRALYEGGEEFEKCLTDFLPKRPNEPEERYELRKKEAVYRNYVGPIVDYFTSLLFSSTPRAEAMDEEGEGIEEVDAFYSRFREDCDLQGTNLDDKVKQLLTTAMIERRAWVWVRHPDGEAPRNLAKFAESGLGESWVQSLCFEDVLDWEVDEAGNLEWVVVWEKTARRKALAGGRKDIVETWHHIQVDRVDTYELTYEEGKDPPANTEVPLVNTQMHRYGKVPVVCLDLPIGLWVGKRLESPQLAHFRLSNAQTWGMAATCYAMPVIKVKDPEQFRTRMAMGFGFGFLIHPEEEISWTAPDSAPFDVLEKSIQSHKDEMYRIAHTMALGVENNAAAVGRSGESKAMDARATSVVLLAYARIVKECIEVIYDLVSTAHSDPYTWSVDGLDDFAGNELGELVTILADIEDAGGIPSKTFQVELKSRLAETVLADASLEVKKKIKSEIEQGVEDQSVKAREKREEKALANVAKNLKDEKPADKSSKQPPFPPPQSKQAAQ